MGVKHRRDKANESVVDLMRLLRKLGITKRYFGGALQFAEKYITKEMADEKDRLEIRAKDILQKGG